MTIRENMKLFVHLYEKKSEMRRNDTQEILQKRERERKKMRKKKVTDEYKSRIQHRVDYVNEKTKRF